MSLIEEARSIVKSLKDKKENERLLQEIATQAWEQEHAADMIVSMRAELKEKVLEAAYRGQEDCLLMIYEWSKDGRPNWVNYFKKPFENHVCDEGFTFEFKESKDIHGMPRNDFGEYTIKW